MFRRCLRLAFLAFILAALAGCARAADGPVNLRVMTYNIHHARGTDGKIDVDRIAAVIAAARPDVVCLQEVDRGTARTRRLDIPALLAEQLAMRACFGINFPYQGGEYGNLILTSLPVIDEQNIRIDGPDGPGSRACQRVTVRAGGRPVIIYNTLLDLDAALRRRQATEILAAVADGPVLLAGDMNELPRGQALALFQSSLTDAALRAAGREEPVMWTFPAAAPKRRIDYIFHSADFTAGAAEVPATELAALASDHRPVVVELTLLPSRAPSDRGAVDARPAQ